MKPEYKRVVVYKGTRVDLAVDTITDSNGADHQREVVLHPGAVTIIPEVSDDAICMIRNKRRAIGKILLELPAGTLESRDEDPLAAAHRELAEETGFTSRNMSQILQFYPSPGILDEQMTLFLARDLAAGHQQLDPTEQITTEIVPFKQLIDLIRKGVIEDGKTITGLLYLDLMRRGIA